MVEQKIEPVDLRARDGVSVGHRIISTHCNRKPSITEPTRPAFGGCSSTVSSPVIAKWAAVMIGTMALVTSMARAAPTSSSSAEMTRDELVACLEREELLQASVASHDRRTIEHNELADSIEAENKELLALQKKALADKTLRSTLPARIDAFNARIDALNADAQMLATEQQRINTEVVSYNQTCSARVVDAKVKRQAQAEFQARKGRSVAIAAGASSPLEPASPLAAPVGTPVTFEAGLKAYDQGDYAQALTVWRGLAEQGRPSAQFNIAMMYEQGQGTVKDDTQAARWYVAAAKSGNALAQLKAASMFETGQGVAVDLGSASYWYGEAANNTAQDAADVRRDAQAGLARLPKAYRGGSEEVVAFEGGRFVLRRAANKDCVIALQGEVTSSTSFEFGTIIQKATAVGCPRPLVLLLESPGGDVQAGLKLARHVRDEGMHTVARYECASSCANIFLGGVERVLWGSRAVIGLHQISRVRGFGNAVTSTCIATRDDPALVAMRRELRFLLPQTAEEIMRVAMDTPCDKVTWVKGDRALQLQLATKLEAPDDDVFGPREERASAGRP